MNFFDWTKSKYGRSYIDAEMNYYGYSEWQYGDEMNFRFEGMYWEGTIKQIKDELSKREHVGIFNNKDYRKWLINYRKNNKNGKLRRI